jgi:hypothetical protein
VLGRQNESRIVDVHGSVWQPLQRLFETTSISVAQWAICAAVASSVLWTEEVRKAITRRRVAS